MANDETIKTPPDKSPDHEPAKFDEAETIPLRVDPSGERPNPSRRVVMSGGTDPLIGADLGSYEIVEILGQGGFGKVYRARDKTLGRHVAIKFLHSTVDFRRRALFQREAKAIAALSKHPNIVAIHQWGEYEGQNYFVLEFVEGSAEKLLEEHQDGLPVAMALRIAAECAEALGESHKNKIMHRDIKPANILIEPNNGAVKLTDFGLASFGPSSDFTLGGTISGSPSYMSPEQANADPLDARTDIFSLGVTLYELLCGKRPFEANTAEEIIARIRNNDRILIRTRRPDLPDGVCSIVDKATAFAPASRYQTAQEFARVLRIALQSLERSGRVASEPESTIPAEPEKAQVQSKPRRPSSRAAIIAAALVLAVLLFAAWNHLFSRRGDPTTGNTVLAAAKESMDRKDFSEAVKAYQEYLKQDSQDSVALYGLGLALAGQGRLEDATGILDRIKDGNLRAEVSAALAFEAQRPDARQEIEKAAATARTMYPLVLLARLNAQDGRDDQVVQQLGNLSAGQFNFAYQYAEALQALGQAYYHLNKLDEAKSAFDKLNQSTVPGLRDTASVYSAEISKKRDDSRREQVHIAVQRISEQIKKQETQPVGGDDWTSRPLTFFILPMEAPRSRYAAESGLADFLPAMLGDELDTKTAMNLVDRDIINEILAEQELSSLVGAKEGQLQLGKVLGARIALKLDAVAAGGKEKVMVKADDVETIERIPVPSIELQRNTDPEAVARSLAEGIWREVRRQFPLQGRLYLGENGPETNIGAEVGVAQGMTFEVLSDKSGQPLDNARASVQGNPNANTSKLELTGVDAAKLDKNPEGGLFIRVIDPAAS